MILAASIELWKEMTNSLSLCQRLQVAIDGLDATSDECSRKCANLRSFIMHDPESRTLSFLEWQSLLDQIAATEAAAIFSSGSK